MSEIDKQQIDYLYKLMEREKGDQDMTAALRWAIFQLEQMGREKQTGDLVFRLAFTPEPEINSIMDTGMFNEIIKGYAVLAMQATGEMTHGAIQDVMQEMDAIFDDTDAAAARKAYREL